jgi:hypothetical protein
MQGAPPLQAACQVPHPRPRRAPQGVRTLAPQGVRTLAPQGVRTLVMQGVRTLVMQGVRTLAPQGVRTLVMQGVRTLVMQGVVAAPPAGALAACRACCAASLGAAGSRPQQAVTWALYIQAGRRVLLVLLVAAQACLEPPALPWSEVVAGRYCYLACSAQLQPSCTWWLQLMGLRW